MSFVDLEIVISQVGNPRKDHVVNFLQKNFRENIDFFISFNNEKKHGGQNKKIYKLSQETAEMVINTYNMKHKYVSKVADIEVKCIVMTIENSTIGFICNCLKSSGLSLYRQKRIGKYFVDLYIEEIKLCVECDENGHKNYDEDKEKIRQQFIETTLGCTFLRFNPNEKGFDISEIVNTIIGKYMLHLHQTISSVQSSNF